jgi:hypothetical protein
MSGDTSDKSPREECVTYTSKVYRWQICDMIAAAAAGEADVDADWDRGLGIV